MQNNVHAFITKTWQLLCLPTRLWILLLLWGNSYSSFSLPKQWNREHLGVPKQSCEVELFSFVNTLKWLYIICTTKSRPENETKQFLLWLILQKAALVLVEEKRVLNTQPNYSFLFVKKLYKFREDMSARFLNAINTDFALEIRKTYPLQATISCLDTRKSTTLHSTLGGGELVSIERYNVHTQKLKCFCITQLELHFL